MIESQLKPEYDNALATLIKAAQANAKSRGNANDPHEMEIATDFVKEMFYNKAYVLYRCLKDGASTKGSPEEKWDQAQACYKASNLQIIKAYKIVSDYPSWPWEAECELKSRLFDAEVEFPPFDFLRETTSSNRLLDHNRLIECILSDDHH
jgi:hypothetical protein